MDGIANRASGLRFLWAALCALSAPCVADDDYAVLLESAAAAIEFELSNNWAYTESYLLSERLIVARYDPRRSAGVRWELQSVDGRPPTDEEIGEFRKRRREERPGQSESGSGFDRGQDFAGMIDPDSLSLIRETADHWEFSFVPEEGVYDKWNLLDNLDATLRIARDGPYVEEIRLETSGPFRARFGVKVREFLALAHFGPAAGSGPVVPLNVRVRLSARAFLAFAINETVEASRSDYEYVGTPVE